MKQIFFILIGLLLTFSLNAQKTKTYLTSKLVSGCPKEIEFIQTQMHLSGINYAHLRTGIDSLKVMFGEFTQDNDKGYWISLFNNDKLLTCKLFQLKSDDGTSILSNPIDIKYDNSSKVISVKIQHNSTTGEIQYLWKSDNKMSETATVNDIDKPIQKGKLFPPLKLITLNGDSISIKDFIGKYIVINWWATGCGPCIAEIPGLNSLVDKYKNNSNVIFIAIAFDKKEALETFLKLKEFKYLQTRGDKETSKLFGESFPRHVIVNKEGQISFYCEGGSENRYVDIDEELKKIIKE